MRERGKPERRREQGPAFPCPILLLPTSVPLASGILQVGLLWEVVPKYKETPCPHPLTATPGRPKLLFYRMGERSKIADCPHQHLYRRNSDLRGDNKQKEQTGK